MQVIVEGRKGQVYFRAGTCETQVRIKNKTFSYMNKESSYSGGFLILVELPFLMRILFRVLDKYCLVIIEGLIKWFSR